VHDDMIFVLPTMAARRARLKTFLSAFADTRQGRTSLIIATDEDEQGAWDHLALPPGALVMTAPKMPLSAKVNYWAFPLAARYRLVGFLADDCVPVTPGWDVLLGDAIRGAPGLAYPRNERREDIPEHHLCSSVIIRALGWYLEPKMRHYWTDNVLADITRPLGLLRYLPDVIIRHDHYDVADVEHDGVYRDAEGQGRLDLEAYSRWRDERMTADIRRVAEAAGVSWAVC
jgi:hypothetical protein